MTKEITKAHILQEIQDKFQLRELMPEKFAFSELVIPTYDVGQHLLKPEIRTAIKSITAGPAAYHMFHVPTYQKWQLHRYNVFFITGVYTVAGVMVYRPALPDYIYLDLEAAQSVSYAHDLPKDVTLSPDDWLYISIDGYTSTGNIEMRIDVTIEEVR